MSNRDKAKELYNKLPHNITNREKAHEIDENISNVFGAAIKMAEWKDQQLRKYLEFRKIECLRTAKIVYAYDMSSAGELEIKAKCYDEIINELFGETKQY